MSRMTPRGKQAMEPAPQRRPRDFAAFFEAEYERLARALYLVVGDGSEAEDVAQEAMVRLYERWDRVRGLDDPVGYLYRTALNLYRSRLRRLASRARRLMERSDPSDPTQEIEVRDALDRALDSLSPRAREAVVLVGWVGLTAEEAGRILGIEAVSVRVRLSRARAVLRELAGEHDG